MGYAQRRRQGNPLGETIPAPCHVPNTRGTSTSRQKAGRGSIGVSNTGYARQIVSIGDFMAPIGTENVDTSNEPLLYWLARGANAPN